MKQTVTFTDFRNAFIRMGREDQFSSEALELLYDFLTENEDNCDEEYTLDVIALCCEFSEDTPEDIASMYGFDLPQRSDYSDDDIGLDDWCMECVAEAGRYLDRHTTVVGETDTTIVYLQF